MSPPRPASAPSLSASAAVDSSSPLAPAGLSQSGLHAPGLRRRMACWLYEGLILFALMMVAVMVQSLIASIGLPVLNHPIVLQLVTLTLSGAYLTFFWQRSGQTLPMKTWRIRVVEARGGRLPLRRAVVRYLLACLAWGLPLCIQITSWRLPLGELAVLQIGWVLVWALLSRFHPQRQFWHDVAAGTRLVEDRIHSG